MPENDQEVVAQENDTEITENQPETVAPETTDEQESVDELKKRLATAEAQKEHWRAKAQKSPTQVVVEESKPDSLSTKDVLFLAKADIHEDDVADLIDWAKVKKVSLSEAAKQLKGTLEARAEERKTAAVANISNARRGPTKITDESLLDNARSGKLPEDDGDVERLVKARLFHKG